MTRVRNLLRRGARAVLAVPLFWKILLANAVVVAGAVILGGVLHATAGVVAALAVAGMSLSLLVNAALLRLALEPLDLLEQTVVRVQGGDLAARAPESPLADPALQRVVKTFNAALEGMAASRRRIHRVLARSLETDEAERRRVASVLEDDVAQRLAGLLMRLRLLERDPDRMVLTGLLQESVAEIGRALEIVHGYASERRPAVLEELGLMAALEAEMLRVRERTGIACWISGIEPSRLPADVELVLYRIVREAVTNAARHACARSIGVTVSNGGSAVVATVEDDGCGFDTTRTDDGDGVGLAAMRERTESAGGRFSVWSEPDRGTRIQVEFPVGDDSLMAGAPAVAP